MKTAMQELIDFIESQEYNYLNKEQLESCNKIQTKAKELIGKERLQIVEAVDYGYELCFSDDDNTYSKGDEYFCETFGDKVG
jgi:hypothetical protein